MVVRQLTKETKKQRKVKWSAGECATIRFGANDVPVEIVEDRGPVGISGRRLVRVRIIESEGEVESTFEVPADELTFVGAG